MNTIVVPTDFSAAAEHATAYAAQLARHLQAGILLLHVYQLPVPMTEFPVLMVTADDVKKTTDDGLNRVREAAQKAYAGITFEVEGRMGDVATEIEEACKERDAFAVVVGTKDLSGFERFLFGDTAASLIKHSSYPVIAVHEEANISTPTNIVLATDLLDIDQIPVQKITTVARLLNANLHVVHVAVEGEQTGSPELLMEKLSGARASYHAIQENDVNKGIRLYVEQNNIDLVLILPHKHSFYERLFFKGHTDGILHSVPVPVMSIRI